jgi:diguanylate cyclase (GGDEF)-like protein
VNAPNGAADESDLETPKAGLYSLVARVVSLVFLASVGAATAISGAWPENAIVIYLLVAIGTIVVVLVEDLWPGGSHGPGRYWAIAIAAICFVAILTTLTGGLSSPFTLGYFLVVAASALSTAGAGPLVLALLAGAMYTGVGLAVGSSLPTNQLIALIGVNLVGLGLVAFVATVVGHEGRRLRAAALRLTRHDPLTGLYNRGFFMSNLEREVQRAARAGGRQFTILMLDLDGLKPVNDTFGHQTGDRLLRSLTEVLLRTVRQTDTAGRYGGDEFAVLLPETSAEGASVVAEKLRREIESVALRVNDRSARTSVSIGLASYPDDAATATDLVAVADAAMYQAKRQGKNQIMGYERRRDAIVTPIVPNTPTTSQPRELVAPDPAFEQLAGPPLRDEIPLAAWETRPSPLEGG